MTPNEVFYDGSLAGLFAVLDRARRTGKAPERILRAGPRPPGRSAGSGRDAGALQGDLFDCAEFAPAAPVPAAGSIYGASDSTAPAGVSAAYFVPSGESAPALFEASVNAFDACVLAWMSEFPIEAAIIRYACRVLSAAEAAAGAPSRTVSEAARREAEKAAADRGDGDARLVLEASYRVGHEIDRLRGFLRFMPDEGGLYTARCSPDHFVLPALGEHFHRRFGNRPWLIIDEKRGLGLSCFPGESPRLQNISPRGFLPGSDEWEGLWRHYHKTINNESRNNPALQRRFMPRRYWKYLPEMN
jgi:probable DNA metabolism protein